MKKKLEAELISIAHRVLQLKDTATLTQLQEEARQLYEKLTILNFSESHFAGPQPTIGQVRKALDENESSELKEVRQKIKEIIEPKPIVPKEEKPEIKKTAESLLAEKLEAEEIPDFNNKPELVIEEVNARVTEDLFVPASVTTEKNVSLSESASQNTTHHKSDITDDNKPKSLNDQLRSDIHIGLNDRLAFIKYLFEGSAADYNRVLSQLNTLRGKKEAEEFVEMMVKPDYNHWKGKDEYAERFIDIVRSKFED